MDIAVYVVMGVITETGALSRICPVLVITPGNQWMADHIKS